MWLVRSPWAVMLAVSELADVIRSMERFLRMTGIGISPAKGIPHSIPLISGSSEIIQ